MNLNRGYVFCVVSGVPLALIWSAVAAVWGDSTVLDWLMFSLVMSIFGLFFTCLLGLLVGLPLVAVLSRIGFANFFTVAAPGALVGFIVYFAWLVVIPLNDPNVTESLRPILEDAGPYMIGFTLSGAFAAAAFWVGAR